jgi:hypothetical protein
MQTSFDLSKLISWTNAHSFDCLSFELIESDSTDINEPLDSREGVSLEEIESSAGVRRFLVIDQSITMFNRLIYLRSTSKVSSVSNVLKASVTVIAETREVNFIITRDQNGNTLGDNQFQTHLLTLAENQGSPLTVTLTGGSNE